MNTEQNEQKSAFSPLQTGCAFVMLTNMLIYLAVVAFVFNLLDPSKLDKEYLAKRVFTSKEEESDEDREFRKLKKENKKQREKVLEERISETTRARKQESSVADKLSQLSERSHASSQLSQPELPKAALIHSRAGGYHGSTKTAKPRQYSVSIYPQATLRRSYSSYRLPNAKTITPERYDTVAVEIAPGIEFPVFQIPVTDNAEDSTYEAPNPVPNPVHGGRKIQAPAQGATPLQTNNTTRTGSNSQTAP